MEILKAKMESVKFRMEKTNNKELIDANNEALDNIHADLKALPNSEAMAKLKRSAEISKSAAYSFKRGLGTLSEGLVNYLRKNPKVEIKTGYEISGLEYHAGSKSIYVSPLPINS